MNIVKLLIITSLLGLSGCAADSALLKRAENIEYLEQTSIDYEFEGKVVVETKENITDIEKVLRLLKLEAASKFEHSELKIANIRSEESQISKPVLRQKSVCQQKDISQLGKGQQEIIGSSPSIAKECSIDYKHSNKSVRIFKFTADVLIGKNK